MKFLAVLSFVVILTHAACAQRRTFTVAPDASDVRITLNTTHEVVHGTFHIQSGSIRFDPADAQISGMIVVAAASGKTGNESRDKKMDKDILKVNEFATISFAPKSFRGTIASSGDSEIQVDGVFTLLGTPHEITVPMHVSIDGLKATAKAHFVVPYLQWGLKNPSFLFWKADNDVTVDLSLAGSVSK